MSLTSKDLIEGEIYYYLSMYPWILRFKKENSNDIFMYGYSKLDLDNGEYTGLSIKISVDNIEELRLATDNEIIELKKVELLYNFKYEEILIDNSYIKELDNLINQSKELYNLK